MSKHQHLGDGVSRQGKEILLNGKHLADAANEHAAEWIARTLALQSTFWMDAAEPDRITPFHVAAALGVGVVAGFIAAAWLGALT